MNDFLVSRSWREAVFYADILREMFNLDSTHLIKQADTLEKADVFLLHGISSNSTEIIQKALASMGQKSTGDDLKAELISFLQKTFNDKGQLKNDDFKWIKDDPRICAFCYYFLKRSSLHAPREEDNEGFKWERYALKSEAERKDLRAILTRENSLKLFRIHTRLITPHSHKDRFEIIESAFHCGEIELSGQQYIMNLLKEAWTTSLQEETNKKFSKWLNGKDHKKVEWFCDYIAKQDNMFYLPWKPGDDEEHYLALKAEFDYVFLEDPKESKYLFMQARLAWNQMTARNKKNGPKSRGISMIERTSKRLDWLAEHKGEKINAVIKELIDKEFEQLNGPEKL
ncbi:MULTISPECIES: hypothetical protein [Vibrio]|uniref:hypothetical protein n=1 Tax=Vibrio TaxID=662 RepID=UPI000C84CFE3|nr:MULTISPECIES: hypothetical protein [Vibrio]PMG67311.1 hypothetical protein BCU86_11340 [Vibrio lentus]TKE93748.1 hypothetical protein FCV53_04310 [Vibrio sp. F12]